MDVVFSYFVLISEIGVEPGLSAGSVKIVNTFLHYIFVIREQHFVLRSYLSVLRRSYGKQDRPNKQT
jgi:hypothetical protein